MLRLVHGRLLRHMSTVGRLLPDGPGLDAFLTTAKSASNTLTQNSTVPNISANDSEPELSYLQVNPHNHANDQESGDVWSEMVTSARAATTAAGNRVYFDIYGCQMNVSDSDLIWTVLHRDGFVKTTDIFEADVILAVTCAIRENPERKVWQRLDLYKSLKVQRRRLNPTAAPIRVGVLGCMAERLKTKLLDADKMVDVVAGPDAYRDLPRLLQLAKSGQSGVNVQLSLEETYADITPVRLNDGQKSAFVSIMRGCDNMCAFCIVPFTRGRERSRPLSSIVAEVKSLSEQGVKEITLLGQNVNSYRYVDGESDLPSPDAVPLTTPGFKTVYKPKVGGIRFAELLETVAKVNTEMRIRFTSPHPKDFTDDVLEVMKRHKNICKHIVMPAQSGSTNVLTAMRRGYTREAYLQLVHKIRQEFPNITLGTDLITGFCGETEADHRDTLALMEEAKFTTAFTFAYSMREKTHAYYKLKDDVPQDVKIERLYQLVETHQRIARELNAGQVGKEQLVLIEKISSRSSQNFVGRNEANLRVVIECGDSNLGIKIGDFVRVRVTSSSAFNFHATPLEVTTIDTFYT